MAYRDDALTFSSRRTSRDEAVEGVRELYAAGSRVEPTAGEVFARVRSRLLPAMAVFERRMNGLSLTRDPALVRRTAFDHFVVQHVTSGELKLELGDSRTTLRVGDVALLDTTRPFATEAVECCFHTLSVPRERLAEAGLDASRMHGATVRGGSAELDAAFAALMGHATQGHADALLDLLLAIRSQMAGVSIGDGPAGLHRRERALAFIEAHLACSDLSPVMVAARSHISRATLYRTFAELGGVSEWILSRRLRRLRTALETDSRPLAELIGKFGFVSLSHATSAFQTRYGVPPGALRTRRRAEMAETRASADTTRRMLDDMPAALARAPDARTRSAA